MADEDWYNPIARPPARQPTPREHIWSLRKNVHQIDCELRFHGESYGWEVQFLERGELMVSRGGFASWRCDGPCKSAERLSARFRYWGE
jgi:hypothetical protein